MIRVEIDDVRFQNNRNTKYILYADTQDEVPETGAATAALAKYGEHGEHNFTGEITMASTIYTADGAFAILNSSDIWSWVANASGGGGGGGMPNPMTSQGDIIVGGDAGAPERLAVGEVGQVLAAGASSVQYTNNLPYLTTAPTEANTDGGVKIVVLSADPATKYAGYLYVITAS